MGKIYVLDSCTVRYWLKIKKRFSSFYILEFQKLELKKYLKDFLAYGGAIIEKPYTTPGDHNFFELDPQIYAILTYDKSLKRQLKKRGYKTYV